MQPHGQTKLAHIYFVPMNLHVSLHFYRLFTGTVRTKGSDLGYLSFHHARTTLTTTSQPVGTPRILHRNPWVEFSPIQKVCLETGSNNTVYARIRSKKISLSTAADIILVKPNGQEQNCHHWSFWCHQQKKHLQPSLFPAYWCSFCSTDSSTARQLQNGQKKKANIKQKHPLSTRFLAKSSTL